MPVSYTKTGGQGHVYQVPDYPEAADGPKAFKDYSDFLDIILPPVGTVMPYVGTTAPTGWLLCDGGQYSSTTYPKLSALCGTRFGSATTGNFRIPDLKGRVVAGVDSSQTEFDTLGESGGAKTVTLSVSNLPSHTHSVGAHSHSLNNHTHSTPNHDHTFSTPSHQHSFTVSGSTGQDGDHAHVSYHSNIEGYDFSQPLTTSVPITPNVYSNPTSTAGSHSHTFSASGTTGSSSGTSGTTSSSGASTSGGPSQTNTGNSTAFDTASTGSGSGVSVVQPYMALNYIIRAA